MNKQNLIVLGGIFALIALVAVLAMVVPQNRTPLSGDAPSLNAADAPAATASTAPADAQSPAATELPPADAYLVASVRGVLYEPIPLLEEGSYTIKQGDSMSNTVHVTHDSIWMEHSSCDNQDCVLQGTVSLDNMESRVLANMIICLPNEVVLELHTPDTLKTVLGLQQ